MIGVDSGANDVLANPTTVHLRPQPALDARGGRWFHWNTTDDQQPTIVARDG